MANSQNASASHTPTEEKWIARTSRGRYYEFLMPSGSTTEQAFERAQSKISRNTVHVEKITDAK